MFLAESQPPDRYEDKLASMRTLYVGFVGFTIYIWDHMITFGDEVDLIWTGKKGIPIYVFLINRYLTPLGFIINLVAYTLPSWTEWECAHFVRFEGAMTAIGIELAGLMMLLRVRAMYPGKNLAILVVPFIFLVWVGVTAWMLAGAGPVDHDHDGVHSCTMIFSSTANRAAAASTAWLPLLYDTLVFSLTLYRTLPHILHKQAGFVIRSLFADGVLYYSVICSINLILTVMIIRASPDLQNITAQLELLLTVTMMSRITLNLRKKDRYGETQLSYDDDSEVVTSDRTQLRSRSSAQRKSIPSLPTSAHMSPIFNCGKRPGSADSDMSDSPTIRVSDTFELPPRRKRLSTIVDMSVASTPMPPSSPVEDYQSLDEEVRFTPTQDSQQRHGTPSEEMRFASPPPSARSASVQSNHSSRRREEFEDDLRFFVRESDRNARLARRQRSEAEEDLHFENPHSARADLFPHHEEPEDDDDSLRYYVPNSSASNYFSRRRWASDDGTILHPYSSRSESFQLRPVSSRSASFSFAEDIEAQYPRLSRTLPMPPPSAGVPQTPHTRHSLRMPRTHRALPQTPSEQEFGL